MGAGAKGRGVRREGLTIEVFVKLDGGGLIMLFAWRMERGGR